MSHRSPLAHPFRPHGLSGGRLSLSHGVGVDGDGLFRRQRQSLVPQLRVASRSSLGRRLLSYRAVITYSSYCAKVPKGPGLFIIAVSGALALLLQRREWASAIPVDALETGLGALGPLLGVCRQACEQPRIPLFRYLSCLIYSNAPFPVARGMTFAIAGCPRYLSLAGPVL